MADNNGPQQESAVEPGELPPQVPALLPMKRWRMRSSPLVDKIVALSICSMAGESLRILIYNFFGLACHLPGTVGWNVSGWASCTTDPGITSSAGGGLFSDLPANCLGCFLMGLFVNGNDQTLGLPIHTNLAFLPRDNAFQSWKITHLGMRTGLCGSLTSFSSWNAQMVVMIVAGQGTVLGSQWVSALFGYMIGWMVALQTFYVGRNVALMLHRWHNPDLAQEADRIKERKIELLNRDLPDLERRYLYDLMDTYEDPISEEGYVSEGGFLHLQEWKQQTRRHRYQQVEGGSFLTELHAIERLILVERREPDEELLEVACNAGWDVDALRRWQKRNHDGSVSERVDGVAHAKYSGRIRNEQVFNVVTLIVATGLLLWGVITQSGSDLVSINYRANFLAALLAPLGTLVRWRLSFWNGTIRNSKWHWLPIGTFATNMLGCCISALMLALLLETEGTVSALATSFIMATKIGFAGCVSTVSTFMVEVAVLMQSLPQHAWGYYYLTLTLSTGCILGVVFYVWAAV